MHIASAPAVIPERLPAIASVCILGCGGLASSVTGAGSDGGGGSHGADGGSSSGASSGSSGGASSGSSGGQAPINQRPNDAPCSTTPPPGDCNGTGNPRDACKADAQCTAGANGRCITDNSGPVPYCACTFDACARDSSCASGSTCVCHGSAYTAGAGNSCVASNCRINADCGPAGFCSPSRDLTTCDGTGVSGYFCHTPSNLCINDGDCPAAPQGPGACIYSAGPSRWQCGTVAGCE